ncbi:MAG: hypothetical protein ABIM60_05830 [candidate division WOR-3 bacterium]
MKSKKNVILKSINLLLISFLLSCRSCKEPFKRNPNLELLLKNDWDSFFNPVWAPNGEIIYYLRAHRENLPVEATQLAIGGELWKININTKQKKFLLKGPFSSLSISPDGNLLALSYEREGSEIEWEGGPLILADTLGNIIDTLIKDSTFVQEVKFNSIGDYIYFFAIKYSEGKKQCGIYRIRIDGTEENLVKPIYDCYYRVNFYLDRNDSIYFGKGDFNYKKNLEAMIHGEVMLGPAELKIKELATNKIFIPDADPYGPPEADSGFESAYWSPDGEKLILSVGKVESECSGTFVKNLELWILHKVW